LTRLVGVYILMRASLANVFVLLAVLVILEKLSNDVTKYRGIPVSRYFSDGINSSSIFRYRASLDSTTYGKQTRIYYDYNIDYTRYIVSRPLSYILCALWGAATY